ncbi:MAG: multidrug efflux SMR transporter [Verrucomicrobiota bacterium]
MHWIYLILGILFEVAGSACMKFSKGFTYMTPSILIFVFYGIAFFFLNLCVKTLEIGMVYAMWAGIGTALIALLGILCFQESASFSKLFFIGLIIVGVGGLHLTSMSHS